MATETLMAKIAQILKKGGIGVIPTDTLYGIVGRALNKKSVAKIYRFKKRNLKKPLIILISSLDDLKKFKIKLQPAHYPLIAKFWPGRTSIIFECYASKYKYLHRGTNSLAFRLPKDQNLVKLIKKTGPLVAPSANIEGKPPAKTIKTARKYFGDKMDFYLNAGRLKRKPSKLIQLIDNGLKILRK